ncbi:MAG: hypothetical protein BWZ10_01883 [candidate division BRC1 bacterium ADurb.BinA364]|nr:MAG: hypothetical protein BWZ10_01883 [candidate division BRC1 bacterium ADurb.BinA364]
MGLPDRLAANASSFSTGKRNDDNTRRFSLERQNASAGQPRQPPGSGADRMDRAPARGSASRIALPDRHCSNHGRQNPRLAACPHRRQGRIHQRNRNCSSAPRDRFGCPQSEGPARGSTRGVAVSRGLPARISRRCFDRPPAARLEILGAGMHGRHFEPAPPRSIGARQSKNPYSGPARQRADSHSASRRRRIGRDCAGARGDTAIGHIRALDGRPGFRFDAARAGARRLGISDSPGRCRGGRNRFGFA